MSATTIAVSGMNAASLRLQVAARNIANARSNGALPGADTPEDAPQAYAPQRVDQVATAGGTSARVTPVSPPSVPVYDPTAPYADENGMVAAPNVDLATELVEVMVAKYTFAANAAVVRAESDMMKSLLDIKT
jgi:flagellar basal-body rod protein FlgC